MAINTAFLPKSVQAALAANPDLYKRSTTAARDRANSLGFNMSSEGGQTQGYGANILGGDQGSAFANLGDTWNGQGLLDNQGWVPIDSTIDFTDKDKWLPGAEQAVLGATKWDDKLGLLADYGVMDKWGLAPKATFMDKLVPAMILGAGAYGIGGGLLNAMNTGGFMPAGGAGFDSATMFSGGGGGLSGGAGGAAGIGADFVGPPPELGPYGPGLNSGFPTDFVGPPAEYGPYGPGLNDGIAADFVGPPPELNQYPFTPSGEFVGPPSSLSNGKSLFQSIKDLIKTPTPSGGGSGGGGGNGGGMNFSDWLNLGGTVAGIGTSIWSGNKQADAASDAAKLQAAGQAAALEELKRQFDLSRADQMPWLTAGKDSLAQLSALMAPGGALTRKFGAADFEADPGYQFQLAEGEQAANRAAAARGGYNSGRTLKELMRYGQGLASTTYQDAYNRYNTDQSNLYNRLAGIAGTGQTAATTLGNAGANYAANVGNTLTGGADAQAASRIAGANARTSGYMGAANAITGGINNYQQSQLLSQLLRQYGA